MKSAEVRKSYIAEPYYYRQKLSCRQSGLHEMVHRQTRQKDEAILLRRTPKYQSFKKHIVMLEEIMEVIDKFLDKGVGKYRITEKKCKEKKKSLKSAARA